MKIFLLLFLLCLPAAASLLAQDQSAIDALLLDAQYDKAIAQIDAQRGRTKEADAIVALENKKAEALIRMGKFTEADDLLKGTAARAATSKFLLAITQTNYGLLYLNQGRNDLALEALQNALTNFDADGKGESLEAAQALSHLGNLYRATGKYAQAEEQLNMALSHRQKKLKDKSELIAASYNDLGLVYSITDADKALEYYEKALAIYEDLHGKEHPKIAIATTNIGFAYSTLELYGDAVNNFESALKIWEKVYPQAHPAKAFVLFNLGETYLKIGNQQSAAGYYERARVMYEESYGKKHPDLARIQNAIGNLAVLRGQYAVALQHFQTALQANVSDFTSADLARNPALRNFYDGNVLLYSLLNKAQALESLYFGKTLRFHDLDLAVHTLQRCDTLIDKLRQQITNESDKIRLGMIANEVYADGVRICNEAGKVAFRKRRYFEQAFYFAEKSKSAVLLEAISDANAKSFAGIPADLLEEEKNLKSAIALVAQKLAQKPSAEEEKYLREASFSLNRAYEAFTKKLETQFPEYFNLKFNATAPSIPQLQSRLDGHTALLSYFVDEKNSRLYIFRITQSKYAIVEHALPKEFDRYITGMRNSLFFNDLKTYSLAAAKLSALLIPKLPSPINELVILPTGRMSIIPFEALLTADVAEADRNFKTMPYLINRYSVRYEFSAGLILQKSGSKKSPLAPSIFLCAPVTFAEKEGLSELPGTESEVNEISQLFASRNFTHGLYVRQRADEGLVKSGSAKNFSYLHFATHGVVDESNPELSRIFLQPDQGSEDGNLFAGEIYNLELRAQLVTLSACQTGLGKISKGEGVIGLSRALVYAGAQNIIVSFWSVADASTAALMTDFYSKMLETPGVGFAGNLRKAKVKMIQEGNYAAPFYWAPFILIGFE